MKLMNDRYLIVSTQLGRWRQTVEMNGSSRLFGCIVSIHPSVRRSWSWSWEKSELNGPTTYIYIVVVL